MNTANYQTMSTSRLLAAYAGDIRFEFVKMTRTLQFAIPTLIFPAMFYLLFGVLLGSAKGNADNALYAFAGLSVFGAMAPGLFGFGVALAFEREYGLLVFKQALPMPPGAYLLARMAMAMIFAGITALMMTALAKFAGHVPLTFVQAGKLYLSIVLGVLPFCAIGLCIGSFVSGQAAPGIVNLIYLPMAALSGLWWPIQIMPPIMQQLAPIFPAYHLNQLAMHAVGAPSMGSFGSHIASLAGFMIVFLMIAMRKLSSGGMRMFGGDGATVGSPASRVVSRALLFAGIGLIVVGFLGGIAAAPAEPKSSDDSSAASNATESADGPVGIAAPDSPVVADFDSGSDVAAYGGGFMAVGDDMRGGNSKVTQKVVEGGAENSKGSLEITGSIGDGIQYPFAGTGFHPNDAGKDSLMDYSGKHTMRFFARGDGRQYTVVFVGVRVDGIPPMYSFKADADWKEVRIPLGSLAAFDPRRVKDIAIGATAPVGDFRFQIDNVRIE